MAQIVGAFYTSHSQFCYSKPEFWNKTRGGRVLRADVPLDDMETNQSKAERVRSSLATLKRKVAEAKPDVMVIFGDDQLECFDFRNYPAFSVYVGESFEGYVVDRDTPMGMQPPPGTRKRMRVQGHPRFATALLSGLMRQGFDPSFCMDMPKPEEGLGHAFMRPVQSMTDFNIPVVPVLMNCFYAPQPSAARCYALGKATRAVVEAMPENLRVALIGSGGLWHTPRKLGAWVNEAFDVEMLAHLEKGDAHAMAAQFDSYQIPPDDSSQDVGVCGPEVTGMPGMGGPQGGTRETCAWIAAAAAVEGVTTTIVDRVPIYASPIDTAYAYSNH